MNSDREGVIPLDDEIQERLSIYFNNINLKIDLAKEVERLTNNWNELEEWVKQRIDNVKYNSYDDILDKMKEIKGNDISKTQ